MIWIAEVAYEVVGELGGRRFCLGVGYWSCLRIMIIETRAWSPSRERFTAFRKIMPIRFPLVPKTLVGWLTSYVEKARKMERLTNGMDGTLFFRCLIENGPGGHDGGDSLRYGEVSVVVGPRELIV